MIEAGFLSVVRPFDLLPDLLQGLWVTVQVYLGASVVAVGIALLAGLCRLSAALPLRWGAVTYVEVFRGTSAVVQLFWFYYVLPLFGVHLPAMATGIVVLGLNYGAYGAEVVRGAVAAVPVGAGRGGRSAKPAPVAAAAIGGLAPGDRADAAADG